MTNATPEVRNTDQEAKAKPGPRATCRCGHDFEHFMVTPENDYSFWGWVLVWTGVSAIPTRVRFRCRDCGEVFAETDDLELRRRYR